MPLRRVTILVSDEIFNQIIGALDTNLQENSSAFIRRAIVNELQSRANARPVEVPSAPKYRRQLVAAPPQFGTADLPSMASPIPKRAPAYVSEWNDTTENMTQHEYDYTNGRTKIKPPNWP